MSPPEKSGVSAIIFHTHMRSGNPRWCNSIMPPSVAASNLDCNFRCLGWRCSFAQDRPELVLKCRKRRQQHGGIGHARGFHAACNVVGRSRLPSLSRSGALAANSACKIAFGNSDRPPIGADSCYAGCVIRTALAWCCWQAPRPAHSERRDRALLAQGA
jgi:hypothetical protein